MMYKPIPNLKIRYSTNKNLFKVRSEREMLNLFNVDKKPLRKKDLTAYYYDDKGNFVRVPSHTDDVKDIRTFVDSCVKKKIPDVDIAYVDQLWEDALKKKSIIIDILEQLKKEKEAEGDKTRKIAYLRAIRTLKLIKIPVLTEEQAKKLPGIGAKIAAKIEEIVKSGKLKTLEERTEYAIQRKIVVEKFMNIWGVGSKIANKWYDEGYRTMEDLPSEELTKQQLVGIKYYDDFQIPIPRGEVKKITDKIIKIFHYYNSDIDVCVCGSYRRGAKILNDIDLLVTVKNGDKEKGLMKKLVELLQESDIVTEVPSLGSKKFMGVVKGENDVSRRIDIRYIPYEDWGAGLLYFTGPQQFVVQMRIQATRQGYKLSEYGLFKLKPRGEEKVPTTTEKDIFDKLQMKYVEPEDRV